MIKLDARIDLVVLTNWGRNLQKLEVSKKKFYDSNLSRIKQDDCIDSEKFTISFSIKYGFHFLKVKIDMNTPISNNIHKSPAR